MQKLNPITHPLNTVSLIEASAGTGKTYTMVALYLRLLLNAGQNGLNRALTVEEILVMTFTEAATQELKDRIRQRIVEIKALFSEAMNRQSALPPSDDPFVSELYQAVKADLPSAVLRLDMAQQNMDMAAIFTIHGFCYRMLMRYAFDSGVHFNLEMMPQHDELLLRFCREYWRENYYPQNLPVSRFIRQNLKSPQAVFETIKFELSGEMPQVRLPLAYQGDLNTFLQQHLSVYAEQISVLKAAWREAYDDIQSLITAEMARKKDKRLDGRRYQPRFVLPAMESIQRWAQSDEIVLHDKLAFYFSQQNLDQKTKGDAKISHPLFARVDQLAQTDLEFYQKILYWHYINGVRAKLESYKAGHKEVSFDDLLSRLKTALYAENGRSLAQLIRRQFSFAMIDEFQDTDIEQYHIFKRLYIDQPNSGDSGMIMIGDPKQSIYAFRNADIFTYLAAAESAVQRFTLDTNWRSTPALIGAVNKLFAGAQNPFVYSQIRFQPVNAGKKATLLHLNGVLQPPLNFIINDDDKADMAAACAVSVQQWLKAIERQQLTFDDPTVSLQAKDLAVLVRNKKEAASIKSALAVLGIQSVYLSDRSSVLDSEWAQVIVYLLYACLNPQQENAVMTVLASRLFHFDAAELFRLRQDEKAWESRIKDFTRYRRIWQTQGVLPMIHCILQQQKLVPKLLAMADGERAVTDILHLAEFLQQGASLNENEYALLSWFEQTVRLHNPEADEVRLRLESERNLVKIVTVHKSKGLEYGVVWLPFLGRGQLQPRKSSRLTRYHDEKNQLYYDLTSAHQADSLKENMAEALRLLYVALTRARYQLNIGFPSQIGLKSDWNPLAYLLSPQEMALAPKSNVEFVTATILSQRLDQSEYRLTALSALQADEWRAAEARQQVLQAAVFGGRIEHNWRVSSFTALAAMQQRNQNRTRLDQAEYAGKSSAYLDSAYDDDGELPEYALLSENADVAMPDLKQWQMQAQNPFTLPQGARVGNILHDFLRYADFARPPDAETLLSLCRQLDLASESWQSPLQQWLQQIYRTPLDLRQSVRLDRLTAADCLKEMAFMISVDRPLNMHTLNRLLQQYHPPAAEQAPLQLDSIKGMLRGFIDLVCRIDGKYYLMDYKSNFLGEGYQAYLPAILRRVVAYHRYDLQYLIYTVALHRYLKRRDPDYDYQRDFGGVYYLFLRGMDGVGNDSGVYFNKPQWQLIDGLDKVLAGQ
ncbi:hypothetical protein OA57_04750 [Chelonobacter oris]|uniref:RecBCD enzyme subunit RecB n=1 Tax=Chelonobacter oris TaxID=505317 RepID=A0A0A3AMT3_9PAST|nr:exodeoxyribonuclease V subunit beta [Chelonobacter oris]KGQ70678.1 hypothetical protein OA57_04750 [Chelonobacter oris]